MDRPDVVVVRGGIQVRRLGVRDLADVTRALDAAEADAGGPLVDESERVRLTAAMDGSSWPSRWQPVAAFRGTTPVGYAALVGAGGDDTVATASGDAAVLAADPTRAVFGALLSAQRTVAAEAQVAELVVWVRRGGEREIDVAAVERYEVDRRLGVLGRRLAPLPAPVEAVGHTIRAYRPDLDDDGVVAVLAAAYADTPEAGWDLARFRERRGWSWFRPEDLLLAVDDADGHVAGLHWLKRRDAATGEVYNLAVHPDAQGKRIGPALLSAGLHHLADVGCAEVVLWVDRANERAVALYEAQGFATLWDDLAFRADLRHHHP